MILLLVQLSIGAVNNGTMEINIDVPEYDNDSDYIYGFQFNVGVQPYHLSGGLAQDAGFTLSVGPQ